jgi:hypothetical protein
MLGICITLLEANLIWLKYALFVVLFGFYALVIATALFKEGEMALKTRNENDLFRRKMVETGEEYPLKLAEEYKWWKGIVVGLITATPATLLTLIHLCVLLGNAPHNAFGGIAGIISMPVFGFFMADGVAVAIDYLWTFLVLPYCTLICGLGYYFGARKVEKRNKIVEEKRKMIYGE